MLKKLLAVKLVGYRSQVTAVVMMALVVASQFGLLDKLAPEQIETIKDGLLALFGLFIALKIKKNGNGGGE